MEQEKITENSSIQENEYIIWRDETFRVPYRIKATDGYLALIKLNSGTIDQTVNGNNLDTADCVDTKIVTIEKVNKTSEEFERELEARGYAPNL